MKKIPLGVKLFTLLWALALFLPPVREAARTLSFYRSARDIFSSSPPDSLPPNDPTTIEWQIEAHADDERGRALTRALGELDDLAARFPEQRWIVAARLRRTAGFAWSFHLEDGTAPKQGKTPIFLSAKELEHTAQIAAAAGKQEPDNSFWPWMEAFFRFALHQNDAGAACMERAGSAARFDDYTQSLARTRIALWEKYDHPAFEQKIGVWAGILFPHFSSMRATCRATAYQALLARKRGENARAVRLGTAILRANKVLHHDSWAVIGSLVAQADAIASLEILVAEPLPKSATPPSGVAQHKSRGAPPITAMSPDAIAQHKQKLKVKWAQFARANGRPDLATDADWITLPLATQTLAAYYGQAIWGLFGLPPSQGRIAALAPFLLFGWGMFCFALVGAWLVGALCAPRGNSERAPARGKVVACANFGFWLLLGALLVAIQSGWAPGELLAFWGQPDDAPPPPAPFFISMFALACWLVPVALVAWKRDRRFRWVRPIYLAPDSSRGARRGAWVTGGIAAAFIAIGQSLGSNAAMLGFVCVVVSFSSLACASVLTAIRARQAWPRLRLEGETPARSSAPLTWRLARVGAWVGAAWCVFSTWAAGAGALDLPPLAAAFQAPLGILLLVAAVWLGRKIGRGDGFAFRLATRTAGVLSLAGSFAFLMLALAVWPLRAELNHQLDRRLAMREEDWMKEQLAKFPPAPR